MTERQSILIVDDKPQNLLALERTLAELNVSVVRAAGGNEALAATLDHEFALAIVDVQMPGMDGFELAELLRGDDRTGHLPIIFLTAVYDADDKVFRGYEAGAVDYIVKPYSAPVLRAKVRIFLQLDQQRRELLEHRQHLEHLVRDRTRDLQEILRTAMDGFWLFDGQGRLLEVNEAYCQLSGYTRDELLAMRISDLEASESPETTATHIGTIMAAGSDRFVTQHRRKDGVVWDVEASVNYLPLAGGRLFSFVRDITKRLQLEAQFHQSQKMEGVGQLASGIAHDFNNLLTVINGTAELVLAQVGEDDPVHADVREIHRAGERAATLTHQLLAFTRQQILEPRVLSLNTVVAGMESLLRRVLGEDVDLMVLLTPDLGHVKADPGQIEQMITNLAVNARDAMPQGGRLTIETENVTIDENYARQHGVAVPPGPYVMLAVSDSGVGMDEATRTRVFEPFFTTKGPGKGTGLGLSTVYGIVKQSHGFIWVYSEVGQGTCFKIYLPQSTEAAGTDRPKRAVKSSTGNETILLVEDNAGLRKLATRLLEPAGYTVLGAATGEEALRVLERHQEPVHLLVSDVVMPGMSGRHLAEQVAQSRPGMKVLFMSGYTSDTLVRHGVSEAQVAFLNKPFTAAGLLRKVRETLDS